MKILIFLILLSLIIGCDNPVETNYIIATTVGVVTDKDTGLPIDSAKVFLYSMEVTTSDWHNFFFKRIILKETRTNKDGFFRIMISLDKDDLYFIGVNKEGYSSSPPPFLDSRNGIGFPKRFQVLNVILTKLP
jgi:hypothetical protein